MRSPVDASMVVPRVRARASTASPGATIRMAFPGERDAGRLKGFCEVEASNREPKWSFAAAVAGAATKSEAADARKGRDKCMVECRGVNE